MKYNLFERFAMWMSEKIPDLWSTTCYKFDIYPYDEPSETEFHLTYKTITIYRRVELC